MCHCSTDLFYYIIIIRFRQTFLMISVNNFIRTVIVGFKKCYIHGFKVINVMSVTIVFPLFNIAFNIILISGIVSLVTSFRGDVAYLYSRQKRII